MEENVVREMRDAVYGPQTDNNWEACRENWMRTDSIRWLRSRPETQAIVKTLLAPNLVSNL